MAKFLEISESRVDLEILRRGILEKIPRKINFEHISLLRRLTTDHDEVVAEIRHPRGVDAVARLADHRACGDEEIEKGEEQFPVARRANVGELGPAEERRGAGQRGQGFAVQRVYNVRLKQELFHGGDDHFLFPFQEDKRMENRKTYHVVKKRLHADAKPCTAGFGLLN